MFNVFYLVDISSKLFTIFLHIKLFFNVMTIPSFKIYAFIFHLFLFVNKSGRYYVHFFPRLRFHFSSFPEILLQ